MKLLLDTQVVLWWVQGDSRLGKKALAAVADIQNQVFVSSISLLEVAIKNRAGKLRVSPNKLVNQLAQEGFTELVYDYSAAVSFAAIPQQNWKDPFDFAIASQAVTNGLLLLTADQNLIQMNWADLKAMDAKK